MKTSANLNYATAWFHHNNIVGTPEIISFERLAEEVRKGQPGVKALSQDHVLEQLAKMGFSPANYGEFCKFVDGTQPKQALACLGSFASTFNGLVSIIYDNGKVFEEGAGNSVVECDVLAIATK